MTLRPDLQVTALLEKICNDAEHHIDKFYIKGINTFSFLLPKQLQEVAVSMLCFSYDLHRRCGPEEDGPEDGGISSKAAKPGSPVLVPESSAELSAGPLAQLNNFARVFTLNTLGPGGSPGPPVKIAHFDDTLLNELLMLAVVAFLTPYPHLRILFHHEKRRLPRSALVMPTTHVS